MKKHTLALAILMSLGVAACSSSGDTKYVTDNAAVDAANAKATAAQAAQTTAEQKATAAEQAQATAEAQATAAAAEKTAAEARATAAEQAKATAEAEKTAAEQAQATAEAEKTAAEQAKATAEAEKTSAEQAKATAEAEKTAAEQAKATAEAEKAAAEAEVLRVKEKAATDIAKAYAEVNNITADLDNPNTAALKKALSTNAGAKSLIQQVENTPDNTNTQVACKTAVCGPYVPATDSTPEKGTKTGGLVYNYDKSYIGYGVIREEVYAEDGATRLTTPANSVFYYVSTPTTDKTQVTNATYTGHLVAFSSTMTTAYSLDPSTFKLVVQDGTISGGIGKAKDKGNAITFERGTIETNSNGVVAFNGNVTFNDNKTWGLSPTGLSSFSGTYEGQFGGTNASELVGTFKTDDKAYLPEGSINKIDPTRPVYGAFGATTTK